jgi:hypothetical protein
MRRTAVFIAVSVVVLFHSGCAKYWYQEGRSFEDCRNARADCFAELSRRTDFGDPLDDYDIEFMDACMRAKGYRPVFSSELPMHVKRDAPESSMHWRYHGIAGTLTGPERIPFYDEEAEGVSRLE